MAGKGQPAGNIKLGISLDSTSFGNTLDEINAKVKQAESNMRANLKAYDSAGRSYEALSQKTKDLSTVMEGQNAKVRELTKRRDEAISKYGEESKQVANLNTQINNATAKYNAYSRQLNDTKKELVYSKTAVNDLSNEIKENERQMNAEVKALKAAGDESGAFEAKQKGLAKQTELSEKAIEEQRKVVKLMADEFGDSANETEDAKRALEKLERQSQISSRQLEALKSSSDQSGKEIEDFGDKSTRSARKLDGLKDKLSSLKSAFSFGAVAGLAHNAISSVVSGVQGLVGEAVNASDSLMKFSKTMEFANFGKSQIESSKKEMKDYADKTVYGLEEILNTTAQLASNGIPNYTELTKAAGNLNAVAGGSSDTFKSVAMMLTQTAGAGKLTTENWNQLADAIPGASGLLQDAMLKNGAYTGNFRDAMAQGQITSDEFNQAIVQLGMNDGAVKAATSTDTLSGSWEQMKSTVINGLQSIIEKIGVENITGFINRVTKGIENSIPKITQFIGWLRDIGTWIVENREPLTWIVGIIGGITLAVKALNVASMLLAITGGTLAAPFVAIGVALGALAGALVIAYTKSETFRNIVNAAFTAVKNVVMSVINNLVEYYKMLWSVLQWLWEKIKEWASWIGNKFIEMKNSVVNTVQNLWNGVKNFFSNGVGDTWNKVVGWVKNIFNKATELKNNVSDVIGNLWNGIKDTFRRGIDTVFNWFSELPTKMKNAIIGGKNAIVDAFKSIFNAALKAIGKPVNAIIHGASWVLEKLGAEPLQEWDVPQYATGTPAGGHPINGPMMVNDGRGAETVITPDGRAFIPKGRNVVLNAPKGTHVLTAEETAQLQGSKAPKYRYKKGTNFFGNMWDSVKKVAGNVGHTIKNVVGDVWDFISDPGALARKVLGGLDVLGGLTKYPLEVGKGILSKATSALTEKITGLFSSGNLDTSVGTNGVYKYLADVAKSVMKKFPGFVATSGYRPGDPYSHGKRNAIDIALPGVTGGSPRYTEAANYAFDKFASKIGYVITNGKVRDRSGQSGQPATGAWEPWPDGDHYDHVHLNGVKDPQNTQISGDSVGGSGVERWRNVAIRALKMTGQYSTANLNALLNQMRTESNGNPNAVNNWDINAKNGTPSKGLLQVIDPTFRQYAMPGFNSNIFDPLSNILASIRYALSRYGSLTNAYRGVGYANGGIVNQHQIAEIAEGNKPEIIIPLDKAKRSRAMQLLSIAMDKLGVSPKTYGNATTVSSDYEILEAIEKQAATTNQLLSLLLAFFKGNSRTDRDLALDIQKILVRRM
ncbi:MULTISPECIES: tape measure protein [Enterococcus]|uniref:Tape measure protein n=9 Tax=root TaxID=1 RepID=A0A830ZVQ7_9CAUD|nr:MULTISPECIES: tape measure protein [Enterococcus]MBU5580682.1 tape measure protein [Enterococcus sp. S181_ASV_20]BCT02892.1 tape measure protein [Enterococcus phage Entfac.YE1]HAQ1366338.1 tape measure protein [Enterococcus faecium Ef_RPH2]HAQ1383438.1 tape measure protein [Enterococcus faecium Ef_aus0081]HAQ1390087.1 tape measure protein [Enterococcus faecium Ef_aus0087]